ncbi:MAG: LPXTG cell wall anchor domain-containing protein [Myxococcales bacterium]|nr:LPXTG cell wall anchor domain-containing protein [Myxococcales bacterium]
MNKLVFAATMALPSVALAHPGHSHTGVSSNHHIVIGGIVIAIAAGAFFAARLWKQKRSR